MLQYSWRQSGSLYARISLGNARASGPSLGTISAAAAAVKSIPSNNAVSLTDPPKSASNAYPLASYTYCLAPSNSDKADALKEFITYAIGPGQSYGPDLLFAKLPSQILSADKATIAKIGG